MADTQAQSCPFTLGFGGVKGIHEPVHEVLFDPCPVIGDGDVNEVLIIALLLPDVDINPFIGVGRRVPLIKGMAGIAENIKEDLLDLLRVAVRQRQGIGNLL